MFSLFIDTHFDEVVLVLFKDGMVLDKIILNSGYKHSVVTLPSIKELIERNNINKSDIREIIVVVGPGSFTGVRIGVTIAKTLAYSLNSSIKEIDSLMLKALSVNDILSDFYVSIEDKNGAFVGKFDASRKKIGDYVYLSKSDYLSLKNAENVFANVDIDYDKVYVYLKNIPETNVHNVNPLYVKKMEVLK